MKMGIKYYFFNLRVLWYNMQTQFSSIRFGKQFCDVTLSIRHRHIITVVFLTGWYRQSLVWPFFT